MKIRNGFVSNSSSSSFIVVSKNGDLTEEKIIKVFGVEKSTPLYTLSEGISKQIIYNSDEMNKEKFIKENTWNESISEDEFFEEYPYEKELFDKAEKNGWKIYFGLADSYEESTLCELTLNYEDDDIIIEKEGGY